jgi:transcriptional regulator with XRE-family HTH domain|tara:strand:+ start:353 stop:550 length:198 start_codon:yes stop_codon:yes gene_type:complete
MQLEQFRIKQGLSYKKLADFIGVTGVSPAVTVLRWCKGSRIPRPAWMKKIKEKTKGKVLPTNFYE